MSTTSQKAAAVLAAKPAETEKVSTPAEVTTAPAPEAVAGPTDWSIVDGQWKKVAVSGMVEPRDRPSFDPFSIPKEITNGNREYDFMHGGDNRGVMTQLRAEGWIPYKGKGGDGVEMKDGVPHVLGPDAPLMYRPKGVAHRYSAPATEDLLSNERDKHLEAMNEITHAWAKQDRGVDPNALAYADPKEILELKTMLGNGDPELGQVLLNERAGAGLITPDLERKAGKQSFQIPMSDELQASLREARAQAASLLAAADRIERGAAQAA